MWVDGVFYGCTASGLRNMVFQCRGTDVFVVVITIMSERGQRAGVWGRRDFHSFAYRCWHLQNTYEAPIRYVRVRVQRGDFDAPVAVTYCMVRV